MNKIKEMSKKYEFTEETITVRGVTLHRIKALAQFGDVTPGELGGFIQSDENLSHTGDAWVCGDAVVYGDARVYGDAVVYGDARVCGDAEVYGNAEVCGNARVYGDARVASNKDYIVFKNWWSSGRYFTWTRSNDRWAVGCFYGTGEELVAKALEESKEKAEEYKRIVDYVEQIK